VRTAAAGRPSQTSWATCSSFSRSGRRFRKRSESLRAPAVLYREQSLVSKLLRDLLTTDYAAIRIDNGVEHRRALEFIERVMR